eukprot:SAG31_NODE_4028_length_3651_cov_36.316160_3_plen_751_part_00
MRAYDFDVVHAKLIEKFNGDVIGCCGISYFVPAVHFGDVEFAREVATLTMSNLQRAVSQSRKPTREHPEAIGLVVSSAIWCFLAYHVNLLTPAHREQNEAWINDYGLTWDGTTEKIDRLETTLLRKKGDTTQNFYILTAELFEWLCKCGHVLITKTLRTSSVEILTSLPSVDDIIKYSMTTDKCSVAHSSHGAWWNLFIFAASVCEKLHDHNRVLMYTEAAINPDLKKAGSQLPSTLIVAQTMRGKALAALKRRAEAEQAFEAAVQQANTHGLRLLELIALANLKVLALDQLAHKDHVDRRLGATLRLLEGPHEELTPLICGLDASELMRLPPPDANYTKITNTASKVNSSSDVLRDKLAGLKLKELRQRAKATGMRADELESAMDADEPEDLLISFLIEHHEAALEQQGCETSLRSELQELGLKALRKRAKDANISAEQLLNAMDADEPKDAVIDLLLAVWQTNNIEAGRDQSPAMEALRVELESCRLLSLHKRAGDCGVDPVAIEDAMESDCPKSELISLLLTQQMSSVAHADSHDREKLRDELRQMKLMALHKRAKFESVDESAIEDAMDSENPKGGLIDLILLRRPYKSARSETPHFGANKSSEVQPEKQHTAAPNASNKHTHVMLSYQWDHQAQVKRAHDMLTHLGVKCWMDITGGMGSDIYESMAEGVSNASVVVCFMSQKYQDSQNCKLVRWLFQTLNLSNSYHILLRISNAHSSIMPGAEICAAIWGRYHSSYDGGRWLACN